MVDILKETRNAVAMFEGNLVVGNHDSITLLGTTSQIKLRDYSRSVSKLLLSDNDELDAAIEDVVSAIEKFEVHTQKKQHKEIIREYSKILAYIEQVCLFFQLQQAQLLKEIKLLEKLSITVAENIASLGECIKAGKAVLGNRPISNKESISHCQQSFVAADTEQDDMWYLRLGRRIDDLCISHTLALQNQAQIKILYNNNLLLLDRISTVISNTFPIWNSQMTMILGVDRLEQRINAQNQVFKNIQEHSQNENLHSSRSRNKQQLDFDGIIALNHKLRDVLKETASLEQQDMTIRKNIQEALHQIERG
ncbi:MAG: toxic anion resistance protein [Oscillospiraceae bacterium]